MPSGTLSILDNLRHSNGVQGLTNYYRDLLRCDRQSALELINDPDLRFITLYILKSEALSRDVKGFLYPAYSKALELADKISSETSRHFEKEIRLAGSETISLLEWMFTTGTDEYEPDSAYETLMDRIACLLVKSFADRNILPELAALIFFRNRRGALIHELAWAFFESCCIDSLAFIAYRFNSSDKRDVSLAEKLLGFIPGAGDGSVDIRSNGTGFASGMTYDKAMFWISENRPFLYYTGESLHLDSRPQHYRISLAAKYLCTPVSPYTGEPVVPFRDETNDLLSRFNELAEPAKQQLADFSWNLFRQDGSQWSSWISLPLENQLAWLSGMMGGLA